MEINIKDFISEIQKISEMLGYATVPKSRLIDVVLHEYDNYDDYRDEQIKWNKAKINNVWADDATLARVANIVQDRCPKPSPRILCHGSRNGYEVKKLQNLMPNAEVIGTDISDTAKQFGLHEWDFHDRNPDWVGQFDCVYTNSLDQSWKPKAALSVWFEQLAPNGLLIVEHTEGHSPLAASKMDPFGVRPVAFPFVMTQWFGERLSMSFSVGRKANLNLDAYLFQMHLR